MKFLKVASLLLVPLSFPRCVCFLYSLSCRLQNALPNVAQLQLALSGWDGDIVIWAARSAAATSGQAYGRGKAVPHNRGQPVFLWNLLTFFPATIMITFSGGLHGHFLSHYLHVTTCDMSWFNTTCILWASGRRDQLPLDNFKRRASKSTSATCSCEGNQTTVGSRAKKKHLAGIHTSLLGEWWKQRCCSENFAAQPAMLERYYRLTTIGGITCDQQSMHFKLEVHVFGLHPASFATLVSEKGTTC